MTTLSTKFFICPDRDAARQGTDRGADTKNAFITPFMRTCANKNDAPRQRHDGIHLHEFARLHGAGIAKTRARHDNVVQQSQPPSQTARDNP
jgi:hypothetical protein